MKRTIIVAGIILAVIIVAVGAYFLFFAPKSAGMPPNETGSLPSTGNQTAGSTNGSASGTTIGTNFGVISNNPTLDYFVNASNVVTAIQPDGEVIQVSGGNVTTLSSLQVPNILSASFSYDGTKILVSSGDPTAPTVSIFDVATAAWSPLGTGWQSAAWSPVDYRVAYRQDNAANGTETFATINTANPKAAPVTLLTLDAQDLTVAWPTKNQLIISTKSSALFAGSAWLFNMQTSALTPVVYETPGFDAIWNSGATAAAIATAQASTSSAPIPFGLEFSSGNDGLGGGLALIDDEGNALQQIKFITLPSKCEFASQTTTGGNATGATSSVASVSYLFCGVPRDQADLAYNHLPDDYNQLALFTVDDLYRINLQTGAIDTIFNDPTQSLDVSDVKLFNNILFFVNRYDNKLYAISLSA
jgi:hypothetical protein